MSKSAFGVDHGEEVSKVGFRMPKAPNVGAMKPKVQAAGQRAGGMLKPMGSRIGTSLRGMGQNLGQGAGRSFAAGKPMMGGMQRGLGQAAGRTGKWMQQNPMKAGAGILGGGAVAGGAAGASMGNRRRY